MNRQREMDEEFLRKLTIAVVDELCAVWELPLPEREKYDQAFAAVLNRMDFERMEISDAKDDPSFEHLYVVSFMYGLLFGQYTAGKGIPIFYGLHPWERH